MVDNVCEIDHFTTPLTNEDTNLVVITSVITTKSVYTVFTPEERFAQTLETIESVRKRIPKSCIVVLEGSKLSEEHTNIMAKVVDKLVLFNDDPMCMTYKSAGEAYILYRFFSQISFPFKMIFKLSGRYSLTDKFNIEDYNDSQITSRGCTIPEVKEVFTTTLYSIPYSLLKYFTQILLTTFKILPTSGTDIEHIIFKLVDPEKLRMLDHMGIYGLIGGNKDVYIA